MTEISFTSTLRPVTLKEFETFVKGIGRQNCVKYPWTLQESVLAKDTYTQGVIDCSSCLITDGKQALLMHLTPDNETNHAFSFMIPFLRDKIKLGNPDLQAVLIGSKNNKKSLDIYNKFVQLLEYLRIPFSELKNGKTPTHIAYKSSTDEIFISNLSVEKALKQGKNSSQALNLSFEKVSVADCDEIL